MPIITKSLGVIETPNNPHNSVASGVIDLAMELSEYYGKNIRQGNSFTVTGIQAYVMPHNDSVNDDYDTGGSAQVVTNFVPTTAHSRKAWNQAFKMWTKQRSLYTTRGLHPVRNEDFEFAWDHDTKDTNRTSKMLQSITDTGDEWMCLNGDSTQGQDWCLRDYYNTTSRAPQRSADHFSGALYKDNKYGGTKFPATQVMTTSAIASSVITEADDQDNFSLGMFANDWQHFPVPVNILCGLIKYDVRMIPGDTVAQIEDNLVCVLSIAVKKWKPLVIRPKKKKMKSRRGKASGRRFTRKRSRR